MEAIFMNEFIKKYSRDSLLVSVVLILLGLFLIFKPALSINVVMVALGLILAFYGVIQTVSYFSNSRQIEFFNFQLVIGLVSLLAGLVCIFRPKQHTVFKTVPIAVACIIIYRNIAVKRDCFTFNFRVAFYRVLGYCLRTACVNSCIVGRAFALRQY